MESCYFMAGEESYLLKVRVGTMAELEQLVNTLSRLPASAAPGPRSRCRQSGRRGLRHGPIRRKNEGVVRHPKVIVGGRARSVAARHRPRARVCGVNTLDRCCDTTRAWVSRAIGIVEADANRSADTHLLRFPLCADWGIDLYMKDESVHPTGSLKHRLARSLFLYALCNGWITEGTPVIEASSGSTAVSEAYFASLLGLPFIAVMPATTSAEKIALIEFHGGTCHLVDDPAQVVPTARRLAAENGGHYMDQFTYAERATDWRGNNNIAESIFHQMSKERHPIPEWIVVGAGTGGTAPLSAAMCDTRGMRLDCAWWTRRTRRSSPGGATATRTRAWYRFAHRGHRSAGGRAVVHPTVVDRMVRYPTPPRSRVARVREAVGAAAGRLDRHQPVRGVRADRTVA